MKRQGFEFRLACFLIASCQIFALTHAQSLPSERSPQSHPEVPAAASNTGQSFGQLSDGISISSGNAIFSQPRGNSEWLISPCPPLLDLDLVFSQLTPSSTRGLEECSAEATPSESSVVPVSLSATEQNPSAPTPGTQNLTRELNRPLSLISLSAASDRVSSGGNVMKLPEDASRHAPSASLTYFEQTIFFGTPRRPEPRHSICYQPLYFEDPNMERCGLGHGCLTELVSVTRFFGRVPVLPYLATAQPPRSCVPALPECPSCSQFGHDAYLPPLEMHAASVQAAVVVGLIFLIP